MSFWATELSGVSPLVSYTLQHFLGFHQWIRCLTRFSRFSHEGGVYPILVTPDTIRFPFSFNIVEINWTSSHSHAYTIQHQMQCQISTMYTHPCNAVLPHTNAMQFVPMQCNLCHCTKTHDQCMETSTWTFYTIHCVCYEHSCLTHTTFHIFSSRSEYM